MPANWSLILNVLLLAGVVIAISRLMKARREDFRTANLSEPVLCKAENSYSDDIIAVRKIAHDFADEFTAEDILEDSEDVVIAANKSGLSAEESIEKSQNEEQGESLMMFLLAKENRMLAGYELLQTLLSAGLRFGEGQLFHRHQYPNGQGPVLCSLAAATATGVFDLQNIGGFSVRGLCLFMRSSGNPAIDSERLGIMLETARQLSEDLDTVLLDERQAPFTENTVAKYASLLNIRNPAFTSPFGEMTGELSE